MLYLKANRDNSSAWVEVIKEWGGDVPGFYEVICYYPDGEVGGDIMSKEQLDELANP